MVFNKLVENMFLFSSEESILNRWLKRKFYDHYHHRLALLIFFACFSNIRATHMIYGYIGLYLSHSYAFMHACVCVKLDWMIIINIPFFKKWTNERCPLKQKLVVGEDASPRHQATPLGPPISLLVCSFFVSKMFQKLRFVCLIGPNLITNLNHSWDYIHSLHMTDLESSISLSKSNVCGRGFVWLHKQLQLANATEWIHSARNSTRCSFWPL